jgi:hypothetical protein
MVYNWDYFGHMRVVATGVAPHSGDVLDILVAFALLSLH